MLDLLTFVGRYGNAPLLLVRLSAGDTELELGLTAAASSSRRSKVAKPLPFRTNWRAAAEISGAVAGVSARLSTLMLRHMAETVLSYGCAQFGQVRLSRAVMMWLTTSSRTFSSGAAKGPTWICTSSCTMVHSMSSLRSAPRRL